jgi:hypothetical protein
VVQAEGTARGRRDSSSGKGIVFLVERRDDNRVSLEHKVLGAFESRDAAKARVAALEGACWDGYTYMVRFHKVHGSGPALPPQVWICVRSGPAVLEGVKAVFAEKVRRISPSISGPIYFIESNLGTLVTGARAGFLGGSRAPLLPRPDPRNASRERRAQHRGCVLGGRARGGELRPQSAYVHDIPLSSVSILKHGRPGARAPSLMNGCGVVCLGGGG